MSSADIHCLYNVNTFFRILHSLHVFRNPLSQHTWICWLNEEHLQFCLCIYASAKLATLFNNEPTQNDSHYRWEGP